MFLEIRNSFQNTLSDWAKRDLRPTRAHLLLLTDDVEALEEKLKETLHKFNAHHARLKCYQMLMSFCFLHLLVPATWSTCRVYQQFLSDLVWGDGHRFAAVDLPQALGTIMKWYGAGYWFLIHRHFEMNLLQVPQINTAPAQNWFQWSMFRSTSIHQPELVWRRKLLWLVWQFCSTKMRNWRLKIFQRMVCCARVDAAEPWSALPTNDVVLTLFCFIRCACDRCQSFTLTG